MARPAPTATPNFPAPEFQPVFDFPRAFTTGLLQAQRIQLEAFSAWQKSFAAIVQEMWDEWVCRWAGGAPIDA